VESPGGLREIQNLMSCCGGHELKKKGKQASTAMGREEGYGYVEPPNTKGEGGNPKKKKAYVVAQCQAGAIQKGRELDIAQQKEERIGHREKANV